MGAGLGAERGTPLAEVSETWKKIFLAQTGQQKGRMKLCQEEGPLLTGNGGAGPVGEGPPKGTCKPQTAKFLRTILEDSGSRDTDYRCIRYN